MTLNFALDEQDLSTHRFVNQISHGADKIDAQLLQTQTTYAIDQARVVALGNPRYAGQPVNPLAIRLDLSLVGFEAKPGQYAKLVDDNVDTLSSQYKKGIEKPRSSDVSILYRLNDDELKSLIDSGLYADPRQFNRNLNLISTGKEFSIPDRVRITTMEFQDTKNHGIQIGSINQRPTYTIASVQPSSNLTTFSQETPDNSYTSLFSDLSLALTQRRYHPEGNPNFVIAQAEQRVANHEQAVKQRNADEGIFQPETPLVKAPEYDNKNQIQTIEPETQSYQQHRQASREVKPADTSHKVARLSDDDENHLQTVLNAMSRKMAQPSVISSNATLKSSSAVSQSDANDVSNIKPSSHGSNNHQHTDKELGE